MCSVQPPDSASPPSQPHSTLLFSCPRPSASTVSPRQTPKARHEHWPGPPAPLLLTSHSHGTSRHLHRLHSSLAPPVQRLNDTSLPFLAKSSVALRELTRSLNIPALFLAAQPNSGSITPFR